MTKTWLAALAAVAIAAPAFAQQGKAEKSGGEPAAKAEKKAGVTRQDTRLLQDMADADMAEVAVGKLAQQKASSAEVKKYAEHMVEEHSKGLKEGQALARSKGVKLSGAPSKKHQAAAKKLEGMSDSGFDQAYIDLMVKDHGEVLQKLQSGAKAAKDPEIRAAAEKKAPDVEKHLEMAKQIAGSFGASRGGSAGSPQGK